MLNDNEDETQQLVGLTAEVVSAYVANNNVQTNDLPKVIAAVHSALSGMSQPKQPEPEKVVAPMSARKAVQPEYIVSFEDGKHYRSLKRHLAGRGLSPQEYRTKWGLPQDFPMTAPAYSAKRSELAKSLGLGRKRAEPAPAPAPAPKRQGRTKKATPAAEAA